MNIDLNINAEQINAEIVKAVTESVIGDKLKKVVEERVEAAFSNGYNRTNIAEKVIDEEIAAAIRRVLHSPEIAATIEDAARKMLAEKMANGALERAIDKTWEAMFEK